MTASDFKVHDLVRVVNKEFIPHNQVGFVKRITNKNFIWVALKDGVYCCDADDLELLSHEDNLASRKMRLLYENSNYGKIGKINENEMVFIPDEDISFTLSEEKENNMEGENLIRKHFDNLRNTISDGYRKKEENLFNKTKIGQLIAELEAEMQTIEPTVKDIRFMFDRDTIWTQELKVKLRELDKLYEKDMSDLYNQQEQALTLFRMCEMYEQKVELLKRYDCID